MQNKNNEIDVTLIGYARVSTPEQSVSMQVDALIANGVGEDNIYSENISGAKKNRPELAKAMKRLRDGDTLVVWKLDRIARSMVNLLEILEELEKKGVKFKSLTDNIETVTPGGRLILHIMGSIAQFERDLGVERSRAGVRAAQERGVKFGAKHKLQPSEMPKVWSLVNEKGVTRKEVAKQYKVSVQTIARRLKEYEESKSENK